jgi:hypothetical protein
VVTAVSEVGVALPESLDNQQCPEMATGSPPHHDPLQGPSRDAPAGDVVARLREIWLEATPDSISGDLERAHALARSAPATDAERARRYLEAIRRLERWLHDM